MSVSWQLVWLQWSLLGSYVHFTTTSLDLVISARVLPLFHNNSVDYIVDSFIYCDTLQLVDTKCTATCGELVSTQLTVPITDSLLWTSEHCTVLCRLREPGWCLQLGSFFNVSDSRTVLYFGTVHNSNISRVTHKHSGFGLNTCRSCLWSISSIGVFVKGEIFYQIR